MTPAFPRARRLLGRPIRVPLHATRRLWRHRDLIRQLVIREIEQRYRGSYLGLLWSLLSPLLMLLAYTFVFSVVFQARWNVAGPTTSTGEFALILFAGLIPFGVVADCVLRAPTLITGVPHYVKKVVFPLEVLPVVVLGSALIHSLISIVVLVLGILLLLQSISPRLLLLPLAYVPLILLTLGLSWFVAAFGVFVRDVGQAVTVVVQLLMFLTPIFYPPNAVPDWLQAWLAWNPLTVIVGMFRGTLLPDQPLPWEGWALWMVGTSLIALLGYTWFMVSKPAFVDVL